MDLKNQIFNAIETIFSKAFRTPLNSEGLEKLRAACNKLHEATWKVADSAAIERCQKLNNATQEGFKKTSEALQAEYNERTAADAALEDRVKALEEKMHSAFTNVRELIDIQNLNRKIK